MPAKKAAPQKAQSSDMGSVWKWVYLIGGVVAAVTGAFAIHIDVLSWLLVLAGVLVGLFYMDTEDLKGFGIRYLLFAAVVNALGMVPAVGTYLSGFFGGFLAFLGPVALATLFMWFWKKYFSGMM
jgi:hypothetical protein